MMENELKAKNGKWLRASRIVLIIFVIHILLTIYIIGYFLFPTDGFHGGYAGLFLIYTIIAFLILDILLFIAFISLKKGKLLGVVPFCISIFILALLFHRVYVVIFIYIFSLVIITTISEFIISLIKKIKRYKKHNYNELKK